MKTCAWRQAGRTADLGPWSADETLRLWTAEGKPLAQLRGHESSVYGALALHNSRDNCQRFL
jgi:hypothetical protein